MGLSLKKLGSKIFDQVNPLDNGRTYQQRTPTNNRSAIGQATHNGVTNVVGASAVKPLIRSSMALNQGIGNLELKLGGRQTQNAKQYSAGISPNFQQFTDYKGTKNQIGGDLITTAANVAMPGTSNVVKNAFRAVAPKVVPDIALRTVANSGVGAVGGAVNNVGAGLSDNQIHSFNDLKDKALTGAKFGAVLGAGGTLATPVVKAGASKAISAKPVIKPLNEGGKPVNAEMGNRVERGKQLQQQWDKGSGAVRKTIAKEIAKNNQAIAKLDEVGGGAIENSPIRKLLQGEGKAPKAPEPVQNPVSSPKPTPQIGAQASDYTDYLVNKYIDPNAAPTASLRNPVTRASTKVQEVYRGGVDKARDAVNTKLQQGLTSDNPIVASVTEKPTLGWNRFGLKDSTRTIFRAQRGNQENAGRVVRTVGHDLGSQVQALPDPATSMQKVDRFFEEPDYLKRAYGDGTKLPYEKLAPEEQKIVDTMIDMNKLRNDINLEIGNISPELHAKYADGTHSPRLYDVEATKGNRHSPMMDANVGKKRASLNDIEDDVFAKRETNPVMRSMVRAEIALRDKATFDALKQLEAEGLIKNAAPNKNFTQLNGAQYGKFNGKYIYNGARNELSQGLTFNTKMGQALGNLIDSYQDSPLGALDRFFKSTKTTLSPATTAGNIISNPVAFNPASGVNMFTQGKNMAKTSAKMIKDSRGKFDRSLYEARKQGVGVGDTGKQLTGDKRVELGVGKKNSKNPYKIAGSFYGGVDQTAQVALYDELIKRGLTPEVAARRVMAGTQDYGGVGRGVQSLADAPLMGKPFARFTPELLRLTKNNVVYNPVGTAVKIGAVAKGADMLSKASGETEEERKAREEAVGQTQIPYTNLITKAATGRNENLSLNFAVPKGVPVVGDSAVNIARLTGLNYPIEPGGDSTAAVKRQLNPIADITRKDAQGNTVIAPNQMVSSLTGRPIADQIANRDFMNRTISDPKNKTYVEGVGDKGKKFAGKPTKKEQLDSRKQNLAAAYVPFFNEANSIYSSVKGQEDYYGKQRTKTQGALRAGGLKIESNNKEARQKRVESKQFFEGKAEQVNKFLRENPDLKDQYSQLTSNTRTRDTNTKTRDIISPEKWGIIKSDKSGRLYNQLKQEQLDANKKDGQPIDPIYQINSPERVKEVTELRSRPTGDDIEREEILRATTDWYKPFEQAERDYYSANSAYFDKLPKSKGAAKQNPRVEAYTNVPHPEQSALISKYYQAKNQGADTGKNFFKANADQLSKDFSSYKEARLKEINAKRVIEGFDPIKQDTYNNVTFGYEDDESKVAKELYYKLGGSGYGSGGGGGSGSSDPYKYAVSLNQGSVGKPKAFKVSKGSKKIAKAKIKKPKVSIKKSLV